MENKKNPNNPKKQPKQKALALMSRSLRVGQASAPLAVAKFFRPYMEVRAHPKFKDAVVIRGSEYIDQITTPASGTSDVAGRCLCNFYLAPSEFADSRLAQFAKLYEKFRFTKFDLEWEPAVPATQKGTIVIAHDPDIQDPTPPASPQGVRQYCAFEDCAVGPVWSPFKVPCSIKAPDTGYYTNAAPYGTWGGDDRLAFQGQVYVANVSPTALGASQVLGSLIMHYECELFVPQLEDNLQTGHVYNSTTLATAADALKPFLASSAGVTVSDATVGAFQPTDINGTAHLKLQEGLYELTTRYQQNAAGAITSISLL
nr:MAG: putative capsid protein [Permutotetraviridae sp.]